MPQPMRVGFVSFRDILGEGIRADRIRQFLERSGVDILPLGVDFRRPAHGALRTLLSADVVTASLKRLAGVGSGSTLNEYQWAMETRVTDRSLDLAAQDVSMWMGRVDILHAEGFRAGVVCSRLAARHRVPYVYDMHGSVAMEAKLTGSQAWGRWCNAQERSIVQGARRLIVVSDDTAAFVRERYGIPGSAITVAPNGATPCESRATFGAPLTVVYAGNFAAYENIMIFVRAAERARGRFRFWLIGDGKMRNDLIDEINARSLDVAYFGRKSPAVTREFLLRAQVGFIGQTGGPVIDVPGYTNHVACPTKAFEYAICGLPSVFPPGEWAKVLLDADVGVQTASHEPEAFVDAIASLSDEKTWRRVAGNASRIAHERFTWDEMLKPIAGLYQGLQAERERP
jgi:glycosyltransferase involved in cell wall biosynthesis